MVAARSLRTQNPMNLDPAEGCVGFCAMAMVLPGLDSVNTHLLVLEGKPLQQPISVGQALRM